MSFLNALLPSSFSRPAPVPDTNGEPGRVPLRGNRYGEALVQLTGDRYDPLLSEGSLFFTNNYSQGAAVAAAPGAGIVMGAAAQTSFADATAAVLAIANPVAGGVGVTRVRPDSLRLMCSGAGTAGTSYAVALVLDQMARLPAAVVPYAPVPLSNSARLGAVALVLGLTGLTLAAATASRKVVAARVIKSAALAVGDEFILRFGDTPVGDTVINGAGASRLTADVPPVLIEPGYALYLYAWSPGQTAAPSFAFELIHTER